MARSEWIRAIRAKRKRYAGQNLKDGAEKSTKGDVTGRSDTESARAKALSKKLIKAVARTKLKGK